MGASSATTPAEKSGAHAGSASPLTLPVVLVGVVLVAMSISGTAVALPGIGRDLATSGSPLSWVVAGYNLSFAAMTLVAGATADRVGRRRVFAVAALVFAAGFAVTAVSSSILLTDAARIVSGAGGAGVMAAGGAILAASYDGAARNRAFALMGTMAGVGIAIGPTLSGLLITAAGWRGGFVVYTVVGVLITLGATRLPESRAGEPGRTDWAGSVLFVGALTAVMFAVLEGPALGWTHPVVPLTGVAGVLALVAFVLTQRRGVSPVLAPSLVANKGFLGWSLATVTTSVGFLGVLVFLPTFLQAAGGLSAAGAGLTMLLLTAPVLVIPMIAGTLVNRGVPARLLIMVALLLVVAGNLWLVTLSAEGVVGVVLVPLLLVGIGMGVSFGITDGQAMSLVPADSVGTAAGFLNTLRGAAEALVIAAFSATLLSLLTSRLGSSTVAARVSAGEVGGTDAAARIDAWTWSWHLTQVGVAAVCLVLSVVVAVLIFAPARTAGGRTRT